MSLIENIRQYAELTVKMFAESHRVSLAYDEAAVAFLDDFINQSGRKYDQNQQEKLVNILGSFLGECVRENYGGQWEIVNGEPAVKFDEKNAVFPFGKIAKQFQNGAEDSILSFYQIIPIIFKINK